MMEITTQILNVGQRDGLDEVVEAPTDTDMKMKKKKKKYEVSEKDMLVT